MPAQSYFRPIVRFASLLFMVLAAAPIARAQSTEVTITVNGPWDYVKDPDDSTRIFLVAPQADHHLNPIINSASTSPFLSPGRYNLAIANQATSCPVTSPPAGKEPVVFRLPQSPSAAKIRAVIKNAGARYAISLPKPCYYSTDVTAFSIISPAAITTTSPQTNDKAYTTLMILHYFVTAVAGITWTATPDNGNVPTPKLDFDQNKTVGIKIDIDHMPGSNDICDSTSSDSFAKEVALFTPQKFHVWFPEYDMVSGDQRGNNRHYRQGCQDPVATAAAIQSDMPAAAEVRNKIKNVEQYFENPLSENKQSAQQALDEIQTTINHFQSNKFRKKQRNQTTLNEANQELNAAKAQLQGKKPNVTVFDGKHLAAATAFVAMLTPGSGDCHGAQTSVDGTP